MASKKLKKIIISLLIVLFVTVALGYFYYQKNIFWQDEVRFEIIAPEFVEAGEEVKYQLRYKNNSDVRLEDMTIVFEYPENSLIIEEEEEDVIKRGDLRREIRIDELNPGEEETVNFVSLPLGKKNQILQARAWMSYVPRNLTARYEIERTHTLKIEEVPLDLSFQMPSTMDTEKEQSIRVLFSSKMEYPLTDLEVRLFYPDGFEFIRSTPQTDTEENNMWPWPVLNEGDDGAIDIDALISGEPGEAKVFKALIGTWQDNNFIPLKEVSRGTSISESHILLDILINGKEDYIASPGEFVQYEIFFRNLGSETIEDLFLLADLDNQAMDLSKVEPMSGRFQEDRDIIIWSHVFKSELKSLREDEEGKVEFWVEVSEDLYYEPEMTLHVSMEKAREMITTKLNTSLDISQEILFEDSPFEDGGPFPLERGEKSNYALNWEVSSLFSDISDITIKTRLPREVEVGEEKIPEEANLSFNSATGELKIEIEELEVEEVEEFFIELSVTPWENVEKEDVFLYGVEVSAKDEHTKERVTTSLPAITMEEFLKEEEDEEESEEEEEE